jgi:hypothetical protein
MGGAVQGLFGAAQDLFEFDMGGVVPGPKGAPTLALVHGGETIVPTHKGGQVSSGPQQIVVPVYLDGKKIAEAATPYLAADRRSRTGSRRVA